MKKTTNSNSSIWQILSPVLQNLIALILGIIVGSILVKMGFSEEVKKK